MRKITFEIEIEGEDDTALAASLAGFFAQLGQLCYHSAIAGLAKNLFDLVLTESTLFENADAKMTVRRKA